MNSDERRAYWRKSKVRHGTHSGWSTHQLLDEDPCDACRAARARYDESRRDKYKRSRRFTARAQQRARAELVRRHKDEYDELYRQFKEEMREEFYGE